MSAANRTALIVEDNKDELRRLEALIEGDDVRITSVSTGKQALDALKQRKFDCMVLDLGLPDMTGFELLDVIHNHADVDLSDLSVIIHTARSLTAQEETELRRCTEAMLSKVPGQPSDSWMKPVYFFTALRLTSLSRSARF